MQVNDEETCGDNIGGRQEIEAEIDEHASGNTREMDLIEHFFTAASDAPGKTYQEKGARLRSKKRMTNDN